MKLAVQAFVLVLLLVRSCYSSFSSKRMSKANVEIKFSPRVDLENHSITPNMSGLDDRPSSNYVARPTSAYASSFEKKSSSTAESVISNRFLSVSDKIEIETPRFSVFLSSHAGKQISVEEELLTRSLTIYFKLVEENVSLTDFQYESDVIISAAMIFSLYKNDPTAYLKFLKLFESLAARDASNVKTLLMIQMSSFLFSKSLSVESFGTIIVPCFEFMCLLFQNSGVASERENYVEEALNYFLSVSYVSYSSLMTPSNTAKHSKVMESLNSIILSIDTKPLKPLENTYISRYGLLILNTFAKKQVAKKQELLSLWARSSFENLLPGDVSLILSCAISTSDFPTFKLILQSSSVLPDYSLFLSSVNFSSDLFTKELAAYFPKITEMNLTPSKISPIPWNSKTFLAIFRAKASDEEILSYLFVNSCFFLLDVLLLETDLSSINFPLLADAITQTPVIIDVDSLIRNSLRTANTAEFMRIVLLHLGVDTSLVYSTVLLILKDTPDETLTDTHFLLITSFADSLMDLFNFALQMKCRDSIKLIASRVRIETDWQLLESNEISNRKLDFISIGKLEFLEIIDAHFDYFNILL